MPISDLRGAMPTRNSVLRTLATWGPRGAAVAVLMTIGLLINHLRSPRPAPDTRAVVQTVLDSTQQVVRRTTAQVVASAAHVDTIIHVTRRSPGPELAAAERRASLALAEAMRMELDHTRLRASYDSALKVKDSVITQQAADLARVERLATQMRSLHAEALVALAKTDGALQVAQALPPPAPSCGFHCRTGQAVWLAAGVAGGFKLVQGVVRR